MNIKGILAALVIAVSAVAGVSACGSVTAPAPATAVVPPAPVATVSPASACSQVAAWVTGSGLTATSTVESDLRQASTDAGAGDLTALEVTDGPQLAVDASAAAADPMPGAGGSPYLKAMTAIAQAGYDLADGDVNGANEQLSPVGSALQAATAAVENCG